MLFSNLGPLEVVSANRLLELGRPDVDPERVTAYGRLIPQERQITRPAVGRTSDPEIAMQLFLSRNTVEYHLPEVITALGVGGRLELARPPVDQGPPGPR